MKPNKSIYICLILCLALTACGPSHLFGPTITPSPTSTLTPTRTSTPTQTPTPTNTPRPILPVQWNTPIPVSPATINLANAGSLVELARWGSGVIQSIMYSPDGKYLVITTPLGIYFYDTHSLSKVHFLEFARLITFTPDGRKFAYITNPDYTIKIIDPNTWEVENSIPLNQVQEIMFRSDDQILVRGYDGIDILDVQTGDVTLTLNEPLAGRRNTNSIMAISPDGNLVAYVAAADGKTIVVHDLATGALINAFHPDVYIKWINFSPDSKQLISYGVNDSNWTGSPEKVEYWEITTGRRLAFPTITNNCGFGTISPNWEKAILLCYTQIVNVLDLSSEEITTTMDRVLFPKANYFPTPMDILTFSPDSNFFVTTDQDAIIRIWNASTFMLVGGISDFSPERIRGLEITRDGNTLAVQREHSHEMWDIPTALRVSVSRPSYGSGVFSPDGTLWANIQWANYFESSIDIRSVDTWEIIHSLSGFPAVDRSGDDLAFSQDGSLFAAIYHGKALIWNTATWEVENECNVPSYYYQSNVKISPDVRVAVMEDGGGSAYFEIWDIWSCSRLFKLPSNGSIGGIAFSSDGKLVATISNKAIYLWDMSNGDLLQQFHGHSDYISDLIISPDGMMIASVDQSGTLKLWDLTTGQELASRNTYPCVGFSCEQYNILMSTLVAAPDWSYIITGSFDGTVRFWGVEP